MRSPVVKTDSIFFRIFQTYLGILFELLGAPSELGDCYEFQSVEVKQTAFRIDGVFVPRPDAPDQTVILAEVQFQSDEYLYDRMFAEIGLYLVQHRATFDWVMILPEAVEKEFWHELQTFEEERRVTYVTNAERFGFERGVQEGLQHERSLILRQLTRRLGTISPDAESQVRTLSQVQLESLGEALLDFSESGDLVNWLKSHS
jgi:predicted transposase/invertase (TIGR01784 family)